MNHEFLSPAVIAAAKAHAIAEFPKESCGLVSGDRYIACFNYATEPLKDFTIAGEVYAKVEREGGVTAIIHSHPNGNFFPSERDMEGQLTTDVPWGIIVTDGERAADPVCWGDSLPIAPLIGREFMTGVHDCYDLIRDAFRLGKEGMAAQGMPDWPYEPHVFPRVPHADDWFATKDLYADWMAKTGWVPISASEARPGDGYLIKVHSKHLNHAGILVGNNLILDHRPQRLSRREPAGIWARAADMWVRWSPEAAQS